MTFWKFFSITLFACFFIVVAGAQPHRWQQSIKYDMDVNLDVNTNIISGRQTITYFNHSPDTLKKIFVHLFYNAFRRNSMMDEFCKKSDEIVLGKSRSGKDVTDYDGRFKKRISEMTPEEEGYCRVASFKWDGREQKLIQHETILEVLLDKPLLPGRKANFTTQFASQVPKLSRRSGRDSDEGIRYSIGQWYPKLVEYDQEGWHADDYISREFYGIWGEYRVKISIDKNYKLGATGVLKNAAAIGWGYDRDGSALKPVPGKYRTWDFAASNVHDFVWSADTAYKHITRRTSNGPLLHFIYKDNPAIEAQWQATADTCAMIYPFLSKTFGSYPYPTYSFLHGGGGGTEYPMATLIRNGSLATAIHEWCHSWYQMMLGTNENEYAWMDEGFADYAEARVFAWLHKKNFFEGAAEYENYYKLARGIFDEPMSTHANFYETNFAYNTNAYYKGAIFLRQLGYIVGEKNIDKILQEYYRRWRFRHPDANDFMRIAEKQSGLELRWYKELMLNTTKTIDYGIDSLWEENGLGRIRLRKIGSFPMPIDLQLTLKNGSTELHYMPINMTFGKKEDEHFSGKWIPHNEWMWNMPTYVVELDHPLADLKKIEIDPTRRLADINPANNMLELNW